MRVSKVIILGAGLTGLSTAFHLEQAGYTDYQIFEKDSIPGGLLRSNTQDGFTFDFTGHLVHISDPYFKSFVDYVANLSSWSCLQRNAFVYSHDTYTPYPFQSNLYGLPTAVIQECISKFITKKSSQKAPKTFYDWVLKYFGKGIGKHFFFPYNSKILSYDIKKVHPSWTGRFVPNTTLEALFEGALHQKSASSAGYNSSFYYPKQGGIQHLVTSILAKLNTRIITNHQATSIDSKNKTVLFSNGRQESYDHLISTIPLNHLTANLQESSATNLAQTSKKLICNTVLNFNLGINIPQFSNKHWIYFPEKKYEFYRLGFWHNFASSLVPDGCSAIYGEMSYLPGTKSPAQIKNMLIRARAKTLSVLGLSDANVITQKDLTLNHAYVIYDHWREKNLQQLLAQLKELKVHSVGRFGEWKYSSMQEAVLDGKKTAELIVGKVITPNFEEKKIIPATIAHLQLPDQKQIHAKELS